MKHKLFIIFIIAIFAVVMAGCCQSSEIDGEVACALKLAGDNRSEIQCVLDYYKNEGDTLKLRAAKYIIANMPGHFSYRNDSLVIRYYHDVDSVLVAMKGRSPEDVYARIVGVAANYDFSRLEFVPDIEVVRSEYLIHNIERAFRQWRDGQWAQHLTFDEFCEYLLPYKVCELQPLDEWWDFFEYVNGRHLSHISECDMLAHSPYSAAEFLQRYIEAKYGPALTAYDIPISVLDPRVAIKLPFGGCDTYSRSGVAVSRSLGIPVAMDYTPVKSNENVGHSWNVLLNFNGKTLPYNAVIDNPSRQHLPTSKLAKVFRSTYARNKAIAELISTARCVPPIFRNVFQRDVTEEYVKCGRVTIVAPERDDKYLYLAVSRGEDWEVVDFAKLKGGKVRFENVGLDCVYLPVAFTAEEGLTPVGDPFYLDRDGVSRPFVPALDDRRQVSLDRKYQVREYVHFMAMKTDGAQFEASDTKDFNRSIVAAVVARADSHSHEITLSDSVGMHRYWRYNPRALDSFCNIAEIVFYDKYTGERLDGEVFGSEWSGDTAGGAGDKTAAFDGDPLTYFDARERTGAWVAVDFGRPVKVGRIRYLARGDGNCVEEGDNYELLFMSRTGWKSLGTKISHGLSVSFDHVPANALLLLIDRTKGHEHRIFSMDGDRQRFY